MRSSVYKMRVAEKSKCCSTRLTVQRVRMGLLDWVVALGKRISGDLDKVLFPVITVVVRYIVYKVVSREILRLREENRSEVHLAYTLNEHVQTQENA